MSTQSLKSKVAKGAVWTLLEKLSTQVVGFVVGMILARLLTPNDYGTVALTGIFFAVAGVLVDGGFGGALIQKKDADDLDFNLLPVQRRQCDSECGTHEEDAFPS